MKRFFSFLLLVYFLPMFGFMGIHNEESYYCDTSYFESGGTTDYYNVEIGFDTYETSYIRIEIGCPTYKNYNQANSCAPQAGSILIAYYDVTYTNLVPNFDPGNYYNGKYYFRNTNDTMIAVKEQLYDLMGTNTVNPGTSVSQFKNGMNSYVNGRGYNISYQSCGGSFNLENAKQYISQQQPIVLFLNSYEYYDLGAFNVTENSLKMLGKSSNNGHVLVAYGYREYKLYVNGQLSRTEKYLLVSFGDGTNGYLVINSTACIDEAYAISIY